eukprot:7001719-Prymnesium_polylepis.1
MPHGHPSSLRRQKEGRPIPGRRRRRQRRPPSCRRPSYRARRCYGVDDRRFRRRATPWRRAA